MLQSKYDITVTYQHIFGNINTLADALSRAHISDVKKNLALQEINCCSLRVIEPGLFVFYIKSESIFVIDPPLQAWLERASQRQEQAWAPGTVANYWSAITKYLQFCFDMGLCPSAHHLLLEFLAKDTPSPCTIANHLSHIRTYLRKVGVSTIELDINISNGQW